jgi:hypothetical protein
MPAACRERCGGTDFVRRCCGWRVARHPCVRPPPLDARDRPAPRSSCTSVDGWQGGHRQTFRWLPMRCLPHPSISLTSGPVPPPPAWLPSRVCVCHVCVLCACYVNAVCMLCQRVLCVYCVRALSLELLLQKHTPLPNHHTRTNSGVRVVPALRALCALHLLCAPCVRRVCCALRVLPCAARPRAWPAPGARCYLLAVTPCARLVSVSQKGLRHQQSMWGIAGLLFFAG